MKKPPLLNEAENAKASAFMQRHYKKHGKTGMVVLTATATGIALRIEVQCPYCRKTEDVSDYDSW